MTVNAGSIEFIIKADTDALLISNKQVERSLSDLDAGFDKTAKSVGKTEKAMFSLSKAAAAVSSALSIGVIVGAVDEWGQVAARIKMALKSVEGDVEKYGDIQERFLEISNRNGKAIETTQLLYVEAATSMKELGYNTEQTIDYIESLSSSLTANATNANQTQSMLNALSKSMVSGRVAGENWNSIMNATPTLISDIAKQLSIMRGGVKVTEQEVKKMAADGKISFQLFADSVIKARDANNAMADSMDNTVADGFTKLINSAKSYYGEMNQSLGITKSVSAGFAVLTENFDKVSSAITALVAIGAARYFGNLSNSIIKFGADSAKAAIDSRKLATEKLNAAKASLELIRNEKTFALTTQQSLNTQLATAKTEMQRAAIRKQLSVNSAELIALTKAEVVVTNQLAIAQNNLNFASRAAAVAMNLLKGGLALLGGPAGVAMLAAGAVFYFYQKSQEAKQEALAFADSIEELKNKMKELSEVALDGEIAKASRSIEAQKDAISDLESEIEILKNGYKAASSQFDLFGNKSKALAEASDTIKIKTAELEEKKAKLAKTIEFTAEATVELTNRNKDLYDAMNNASGAAGKMGGIIGVLQQKIKAAADEKERLNNAMRDNPRTDDGEKAILNLKEQNELLGIQDKRKRAIRKAEMEASKLTSNDGQAKDIVALATANYDLAESDRERSKESKASSKTTDTATEAIKRQVAEIERLNKSYEDGSKKLAQYDAGKALGDKASPEQIAQAERLAGELYDIQQRLADKRAALEANVIAKAEKLKTDELAQIERQLKAGDISFEESQRRRLGIASEYATKIAEATANNIITPVAENRAKFDPVQALQNENTRKLALMREYYNQEQQLLADSYAKQQMSHEQFTAAKQATDMQYRALITAMDNQYQQQQTAAQWELMRNQSLSYEMLASAVDSFAGNASNVMTGLMTGTMSAADAMRSLGNTILNSVVNSIVQVGVEMLKNFIISKTMGVAAQTANAAAAIAGGAAALAAWTPAAIAASIATGGAAAGSGLASFQSSMLAGQSMSLLGGRRYGGNVSGGNPYRINESGESEIFQTYDGKQAFIPNKSGKVVPADKANGSKGINVSVIFNDYSSGNHQFEAQATQNGDTLTVQAFLTDMHEKGPMHRSITQNTTANTRL